MNFSSTTLLSATLLSLSLITACSDNDDDDEPMDTAAVFDFRVEAPDAYMRIDRMGMPAIATALISSKDSYNEADPDDDIAGQFVPELLGSLDFLHQTLDGQLTGLGLTPCTVVGDGTGSCATAAVPLIIPDTLKIDPSADAGFPNGRQLADPVIDVTLAVALLELTGDPAPHTALDLVGVLNPPANDREFAADFPYLASPN